MDTSESSRVCSLIETVARDIILDFPKGSTDGELVSIRLSETRSCEVGDEAHLFPKHKRRRLCLRSIGSISRVLSILSTCHHLLITKRTVSQRELYYILASSFSDQRELNLALFDSCATLGVPRWSLNVGAATRGVLAGCLIVAPDDSSNLVDCTRVGPVCT